MSTILDQQLPEPDFIDRNPDQVTADMIALYEQLTGKTLYPAQVERFLINVYSYRESLMREAIQDAAKQNLVRYARAPMLDMLGEDVDCPRILATPATCTLQFTFDATTEATGIPAGTQVGTDVVFETSADISVPVGATTAQGAAACTVAGSSGNGFVAGQINGLIGTVTGFNITNAQNINATASGTDDELDDAYRQRIVLAPAAFSVAGPEDAYVYWARSASSTIVAVTVQYPELELNGSALTSTSNVPPGCVYLYILTSSGAPSQQILDDVLAACTPSNRRPVTDFVQAFPCQEVDYQIVAELTVLGTADQDLALSSANTAMAAYVAPRERLMGLDIVREQIIGVLNGPGAYGVYSVNLVQPAQDQQLTPIQWAHCTGIQISIAGTRDQP